MPMTRISSKGIEMAFQSFADRAIRVLQMALLACSAFLAFPAAAKDYTGVVRILVGWPAGGATDVLARLLAERLTTALGQPIIIENKSGAGGLIAAQTLKGAPADGSTVMLALDHTLVILPIINKSAGFDALRDFTPLAGVSVYQNVLAVSASTQVQDLKSFGRWLKAHPNKANIGVPAPASVPEFTALAIARALGTNAIAVPYRGSAPLVVDLLAGQVPAGISSLSEYIEHHRAGRFRILAASGTTRPEVAPDIPTFKELGLAQLDVNPWVAFVGPKGLPPEFVDRFSKAVAVSLLSPEIKEKFRRLGNVATYAAPTELQEWIVRGSRHWSFLFGEAGIKVQ